MRFVLHFIMFCFALIGMAIGTVLAIPYIIGCAIGLGIFEVLRVANHVFLDFYEEW